LSGTPDTDSPNTIGRSYTITAEVEVPNDGGDGMIVTDGGRFGGYGLYLLKGKPLFIYNFFDLERTRWEGQEALAPGKHTLVFDFQYDGPGFGKGGTGVLSVDGKEVASKKIPHTIPFYLTVAETR
jgi:arylsulfatase